jgi:hypothetical protein
MDLNNTLGMSAVYLKLRPQKIAKVQKLSQSPTLSKTESMATCLGRRPAWYPAPVIPRPATNTSQLTRLHPLRRPLFDNRLLTVRRLRA